MELATFFAVGTFWFWSLIVIANICVFAAVECRSGFGLTLTFIASLGLLQWMSDFHALSYMWHNPGLIVVYTICYFGIGTLWAIGKWWFYITNERRRYDLRKIKFCTEKHIPHDQPIPAALQVDWKDALRGRGWAGTWSMTSIDVIPKARTHKNEIYLWIAAFPWSMLWTMINDPVTRLCRYIYYRISDILNQMSERVFAGTEKDLNEGTHAK